MYPHAHNPTLAARAGAQHADEASRRKEEASGAAGGLAVNWLAAAKLPPPPPRDLRQRHEHLRSSAAPSSTSAALPPAPPVTRASRRRVLFSGDASDAAPVHTVHVQVPVAVASEPSSINMSLRLNISTNGSAAATSSSSAPSSASASAASPAKPVHGLAEAPASSCSAVVMPAPAPVASAAGLPSPRASSRKRKGIAFGKRSNSSKEKDSLERQGSASSSDVPAAYLQQQQQHYPQLAPPVSSVAAAVPGAAASSGSSGGNNASSGSRSKSPFEKLNTLKMLLDCGHLTQEEYQERKTQIINEMTGTSTERKKPSPRRVLQPIMKTVVPHNPPDFTRIPKERAEKLSFDVETLDWKATSTRIKLDLVPFATGQLRNAYFLQEMQHGDIGEPHLFVAKFSIRQADPSSYLSDVEMQAVCAHYAELYNEHEPPLKVYYASSWLLKLRDRGDAVCSVEEYLPGAYVKYSNNNGYVGKETSTTEERERNTPHAFSHFTFVASDYRLMVVDIQGVDDSYTDPQIHTADGRGFGAGNLGTFGMEKFLETHRCNEVCRWLGLKSINKEYKAGGTAAPAYQMPFGGKIKKSTNRITEERNTFSRSVTVSEAFGGSEMLQAAVLEEESFSSSVSTGSSSLMYGQNLTQPFMAPVDGKLAADSRGSFRKSPQPIRRGWSGKDAHVDDDEPSALWLFFRRLLCCCQEGW